MAKKNFGHLSAVLPQAGLAILLALALPNPSAAHVCTPEKRWVDTLPDQSITLSRCIYDAIAEKCLSAVATRPWSEDTLLNEILSRSSRRSFAAIIRIDSVRSSHRDSAYAIDGTAYVDRHMKEDVYVTVVEGLRGEADAGRRVFNEAWNMGNVLKGAEYASFFPGRSQLYLALFDSGARFSELVLPATECARELSGYRIQDGRISWSGEGSFPGLSISVERVRAALASAAALGAYAGRGGASGGVRYGSSPQRIVARPGAANMRSRDLKGRAVRGPEGSLDGNTGSLGNLFDPGPENGPGR